MKLTKIIAISIAILLMVFAESYAKTPKAEIGKPAPDFTLTDTYGIAYSLSDFAGQIIVLEWINYDCPFVKKHYESKNMPMLQKKYGDIGVAWLTICSSAPGLQGNFTNEVINERSKNYGTAFKAYLKDEEGTVGKMYDAKTTPHMYVINSEGVLVYAGAIDSISSSSQDDISGADNYVVNAIEALLRNKPVTTTTTKPYGCSVKYK